MSRRDAVSQLLSVWEARLGNLRDVEQFFRGGNHDCEIYAQAATAALTKCRDELMVVRYRTWNVPPVTDARGETMRAALQRIVEWSDCQCEHDTADCCTRVADIDLSRSIQGLCMP